MKRNELISMCKAQRNELSMSQEQLAVKIGQPRQRVVEFESGRSNLTCDALLVILEALGLTIIANNLPIAEGEKRDLIKPKSNAVNQDLKTVQPSNTKPLVVKSKPMAQQQTPQPAKFNLAAELERLKDAKQSG